MSWIHEADMNRLFERGLTESGMRGTYIASSPSPVSQAEFMRELRRVVSRRLAAEGFEFKTCLTASTDRVTTHIKYACQTCRALREEC